MERQFEKIPLKYGWEKVPNWECFFVHREKGPFLSVYVDEMKLAGKKQNINPTWKILMKDVDLGETTLKESVKSARILWRTAEICSNPGFLLEPRKNNQPERRNDIFIVL